MRSKKYRKMFKKHNKQLKDIAKKTRPWDYGWSADFLIEHLKFMRDYYTLGENVVSCEDCEWKEEEEYTRIEIINQILNAYEAFIEYHPDFKELQNIKDDNERRLWIKKTNEYHLSLKHKFFVLLEKNISKLWD